MKEQKNPASIIFKRTFVHRVNRPSRDPIRQNKGPKRIKSSRPSNCRRRPNRGSSYNMHLEDDEEVSKNVETEFESDPKLELESFICVIRNFDLDDSKSNCFIGSTSSKDSVEDFEIEGGYDDYVLNRGQLKILKTGGSLVTSKGSGTAVFIVLSQINPPKYYEVVFEDTLYFLDIDVNLFSGLKHYKSGGYF